MNLGHAASYDEENNRLKESSSVLEGGPGGVNFNGHGQIVKSPKNADALKQQQTGTESTTSIKKITKVSSGVYQQTPPSISRKMSGYGNSILTEQEFIARQRAPHAALVNSIKKLSRDKITTPTNA